MTHITIEIKSKGETCKGCGWHKNPFLLLDVKHTFCRLFHVCIRRDGEFPTRAVECINSEITIECGTCADVGRDDICSKSEWKDGGYEERCRDNSFKYWKPPIVGNK